MLIFLGSKKIVDSVAPNGLASLVTSDYAFVAIFLKYFFTLVSSPANSAYFSMKIRSCASSLARASCTYFKTEASIMLLWSSKIEETWAYNYKFICVFSKYIILVNKTN